MSARLSGVIAIAAIVGAAAAADCSRTHQPAGSGSETQQGAAAEMTGDKAGAAPASCHNLPSTSDVQGWLERAPEDGGEAGGLFSGHSEWAAIVDRDGVLCGDAASTSDPAAVWPGSQAVARAKAFTANAYSTDTQPLSTARLYTFGQPGHSLWGIAAANPFNPACVEAPGGHAGVGKVCGGTIAFGGGVPLYRGQTRIGGLGVSGDTACTDHEIAKRVRHLAGLDPPKGEFADDIVYRTADGPSVYAHPLCANTWRNGRKIGDEPPATSY